MHGAVAFFIPFTAVAAALPGVGEPVSGLWAVGKTMYTALVLAVTLDVSEGSCVHGAAAATG